MKRSNSYEAAFEGYLQWHRLCYVAVDEGRRALFGETPLKNLDFIVYGACGSRLLVDVKGRRFPTGSEKKPRRVWESWSTRDDLTSLEQWSRLFGPGFEALLVFAYEVLPAVELPDDVEDLWIWRDRRYLLRAVSADDYRQHMRVRSPKWGTVALPNAVYRELARPFCHYVKERREVADQVPF